MRWCRWASGCMPCRRSTAAPLVAFCSVCGHLQSLPKIWKGVIWSRLWPFLAGGLIGVPIGTALLGPSQVRPLKIGVGLLLIFYCAWMAFVRRPPVVMGGGRLADAIGRPRRRRAGRHGEPQRPDPGDLGPVARLDHAGAARRQPALQHERARLLARHRRHRRLPRPHLLRLGGDLPAGDADRRADRPAALPPHQRRAVPSPHPRAARPLRPDPDRLFARHDPEAFAAGFLAVCCTVAAATLPPIGPPRSRLPSRRRPTISSATASDW